MKQIELEGGTLTVRTKHMDEAERIVVEYGGKSREFYPGAKFNLLSATVNDLVHCGECKTAQKNPGLLVCRRTGAVVKEDGFCDYGEKR